MEKKYRNPLLTVDIVIETGGGVVLVERANPPHGWALPGGFVDYGEPLETAARREAEEETGLQISVLEQFHSYSAPDRDPRHHTVTTVFLARAEGEPEGKDDAKRARIFTKDSIPKNMAFDHGRILDDYFRYRSGECKKDIFAL